MGQNLLWNWVKLLRWSLESILNEQLDSADLEKFGKIKKLLKKKTINTTYILWHEKKLVPAIIVLSILRLDYIGYNQINFQETNLSRVAVAARRQVLWK